MTTNKIWMLYAGENVVALKFTLPNLCSVSSLHSYYVVLSSVGVIITV